MAERRATGARRTRRRSHSQNFLRSGRLAAELVRDAGVEPGELVLDLGAGAGRLTSALVRAAADVVAIELDPQLAARLRQQFGANPRVSVVEADTLRVPLPDRPFRVLANLPFHQTNATLRHLLDDPRIPLERADVVVEWGAAIKRATLWPSTLLSVAWGAWHTFSISRRLARVCFVPVPSVDAGVLTIVRRPQPLVAIDEAPCFRSFVAAGFAQPRLRHALAGHVSPRELRRIADALAFPRDAGARDLDVHQWAALFAAASVRPRR